MNKARRKEIGRIVGVLETLREETEFTRDEEQEFLDNMPENLQGGEQAEAAQAAIDALDMAVSSIEAAVSEMGDASN
jgi:hypothetical protein